MARKTDPKQVLENIRAAEYGDSVTPELLAAIYVIEHDKQFEDERGQVRAQLRDLIADDVQESL